MRKCSSGASGAICAMDTKITETWICPRSVAEVSSIRGSCFERRRSVSLIKGGGFESVTQGEEIQLQET